MELLRCLYFYSCWWSRGRFQRTMTPSGPHGRNGIRTPVSRSPGQWPRCSVRSMQNPNQEQLMLPVIPKQHSDDVEITWEKSLFKSQHLSCDSFMGTVILQNTYFLHFNLPIDSTEQSPAPSVRWSEGFHEEVTVFLWAKYCTDQSNSQSPLGSSLNTAVEMNSNSRNRLNNTSN